MVLTVLLIVLVALAIFGGGFLIGDHFATRRHIATLWERQTYLDNAMLSDLATQREVIRDLAKVAGDLEELSPTVH